MRLRSEPPSPSKTPAMARAPVAKPRARAGAGAASLVPMPPATARMDRLAALERAVRSATARKLRVTTNRRRVLDCILQSEQPMSAYAVLRRLRADRPRAAPLSVYRALDFLFHHGFVNRIELLNAYVVRLDRGSGRARQVLVCASCGMIDEIGDRRVADRLRQLARRHGFRIDRQVVELSGLCARCAS